MKITKLNCLLLFFLFLCSCAKNVQQNDKTELTEGGDVGNGGFVVVKDDEYIFYDYFLLSQEASPHSFFNSLPNHLGGLALTEATIENIISLNTQFSNSLLVETFCFYQHLKFKTDKPVASSENSKSGLWNIPATKKPTLFKNYCKNCDVSLAVRFVPKNKDVIPLLPHQKSSYQEKTCSFLPYQTQNGLCQRSGSYFINLNIVEKLDPKNLAALIIHEALWGYLTNNKYKIKPSTNIVPLTKFLYQLPDTSKASPAELSILNQKLQTLLDSYAEK